MEKLHFSSESEYDEDGNRKVIDDDSDDDDRMRDDDMDDDTNNENDETFYGSYTPEADIKDVEDALDED